MNRRGFLGLLGAVAAAAVLDPERALWVRGAKLVSIPKPAPLVTTGWAKGFLEVGDIVSFGSWPERYIVTEAAASVEAIGAARFELLSFHDRRRRENRIGDTVFKSEHLLFVNGPSCLVSHNVMTLGTGTLKRLMPSTRRGR